MRKRVKNLSTIKSSDQDNLTRLNIYSIVIIAVVFSTSVPLQCVMCLCVYLGHFIIYFCFTHKCGVCISGTMYLVVNQSGRGTREGASSLILHIYILTHYSILFSMLGFSCCLNAMTTFLFREKLRRVRLDVVEATQRTNRLILPSIKE